MSELQQIVLVMGACILLAILAIADLRSRPTEHLPDDLNHTRPL